MNQSTATTSAKTNIAWGDIVLAMLDWPFLLFVGLVLFTCYFRGSIAALLARGDIQISWGENRHIKLTEISEGIDEELDPLKEEVQLLKQRVSGLAELAELGQADRDAPNAKKISATDTSSEVSLSNNARENAKQRLLAELLNGRYRWRSIETLAKKVALSEQDTLDILRACVADVVLSIGKSGHRIARHTSR